MIQYAYMVEDKKIDELLSRGVSQCIDPQGVFRKKLQNNPDQIVIKFGVDPTRPDIHLGHAVVLHRLRQFQELGCKVVFLVGDITAQIGDPTGKSKVRPEIDFVEIEKNMMTYIDQVGKILRTDKNVFSWTRNSDWFINVTDISANEGDTVNISTKTESFTTPPLPSNHIIARAGAWLKSKIQKDNIQTVSFVNVLSVLRRISFSRLIERDMFQERIKKGEAVFMHEMLYPVLQGIDSNLIYNIYGSCDLEVGGTDQHFNMLVGRDVMEMNKRIPQSVISFKLLVGLDGKDKMSKSLNNYIAITDEPADMFGKIMSIPDSLIVEYFELCTFTPLDDIESIKIGLENGKLHPKEIKMNLASQVVDMYHGKKAAEEAKEAFENTFSKGEIPELVDIEVTEGTVLVEICLHHGLVSSKGEFTRLVESKSIEHMDSEKIVDDKNSIALTGTYRIGKKRFIKIKVI